MTKRKRSFEFDLPDEEPSITPPQPKEKKRQQRRGPMATAVAETALSTRERAEIEQKVRDENDTLAHEFVRLKQLGLIVDLVPTVAIASDKLVRDRAAVEDSELDELKASIREIGLSNPIRIEEGDDDSFELVQGFRRLVAYRQLHSEHPTDGYDRIPAGIIPKGAALEENYRRMVDENLIRKDISFAEMGELARAFTADPNTICKDVDDAVAILFKSAGYQKRTYIRSFARLLDIIGTHLRFSHALSRNLGLAVLKSLEEHPESKSVLISSLNRCSSEKDELEILKDFVDGVGEGKTPQQPKERRTSLKKAKTTFRIETAGKEFKCIAGTQRIEMSGDTDFSAYEREKLERAVQAFFAALTET